MKGNMREYYYTPLSKVPIRKINFSDTDETLIHNILGGIYTPSQNVDPDYKFDENTKTYIKEKGLTDYYIAGKTTLYQLHKIGFDFDPEKDINDISSIKTDLCVIASFLRGKQLIEVNLIKDFLLFHPTLIKDPTLYSFNTSEKDELTKLLSKCIYFIKTTTKDFIVKAVKSDRVVSLFNDSGDFNQYGFECSIDLITTDNQSIEVECKTPEDAMYLVRLIQSHLKKSKFLTWEELLSLPVMNEEIERFIQEKLSMISELLAPLNDILSNRLDEIFLKREIEPIKKIKNLNCLQYLINKYVDFLYSNPKNDPEIKD